MDYVWFILNIVKIFTQYYVITNIQIYYLPNIIVISDLLYSLWIILSQECIIITIHNINVLYIFSTFVASCIYSLLIIHSILNKNYLPIVWITIPIILAMMKGFSCAFEELLVSNSL
jgi:hypothetical protein